MTTAFPQNGIILPLTKIWNALFAWQSAVRAAAPAPAIGRGNTVDTSFPDAILKKNQEKEQALS